MVSGNEELVSGELRGTVEIDRTRCLIGRERHDLLYARLDRREHHVLGAEDVSFDVLHRVVLSGVYLLKGGRVHDVVDTMQGQLEPLAITNVADKEADPKIIAIGLLHLVLL